MIPSAPTVQNNSHSSFVFNSQFLSLGIYTTKGIKNNNNNTFVECHPCHSLRGAGGTGKLAICYSIEQVSFQPRFKHRESATVDDSRRQRVPSCRHSAAEGSFADVSASERHMEKWNGQ